MERYNLIRVFLAITVSEAVHYIKFGMKSAFLNDDSKEASLHPTDADP